MPEMPNGQPPEAQFTAPVSKELGPLVPGQDYDGYFLGDKSDQDRIQNWLSPNGVFSDSAAVAPAPHQTEHYAHDADRQKALRLAADANLIAAQANPDDFRKSPGTLAKIALLPPIAPADSSLRAGQRVVVPPGDPKGAIGHPGNPSRY